MSDDPKPLSHHSLPIAHQANRQSLRLALRQRRKQVHGAQRRNVALAIARHIARAQLLRAGQSIAVYAALDGEIDLGPLIQQAQRAACIVYAPRIVNMRSRTMAFVEVGARTGPPRGRSTVSSPRMGLHRRIDPRLLDLILLPLVAFDMHGWRLGFGAGFYDRKLAFMRRPRKKPLLIGVGYEFQRVPPQEPAPWDVPLHAVVTEHGLHRCRPRHSGKHGSLTRNEHRVAP